MNAIPCHIWVTSGHIWKWNVSLWKVNHIWPYIWSIYDAYMIHFSWDAFSHHNELHDNYKIISDNLGEVLIVNEWVWIFLLEFIHSLFVIFNLNNAKMFNLDQQRLLYLWTYFCVNLFAPHKWHVRSAKCVTFKVCFCFVFLSKCSIHDIFQGCYMGEKSGLLKVVREVREISKIPKLVREISSCEVYSSILCQQKTLLFYIIRNCMFSQSLANASVEWIEL